MADLIQFDNLRAVLEEFAGEFRDTYRASLLKHDRITQHGTDRLVDSVEANDVKAMVTEGDRAFEVTINLRPYWKYVEEGVRGAKNPGSPYNNPGWKAFPHILNWVEIKPVIPTSGRLASLPRPKQIRSSAYLITRSIVENGTQGSHDFRDSREAVLTRFRTRIRVAMAKDVQNYVRALLAR